MESVEIGSVDRINAETLRTLRRRKGWSQTDLAARCSCRSEQVSRWERGRGSPQPRLRQNLSSALGVKWETLTSPLTEERRPKLDDVLEKVQLNTRVSQRERNALSIVCQRYGVQPGEVIALAPLLFLVLAEKSLAWRRVRAEAVASTADSLPESLPHIESELHVGRARIENAIIAEEASVEARDIFGRHLELENTQPGNPLMAYLGSQASDLIDDKLIGYIDAQYPEENDYLILAGADLRRATGLTGERPGDRKILMYIRIGAISLEEVIEQKRKLGAKDYLVWLDGRVKEIQSQSISDLDALFAEVLSEGCERGEGEGDDD